MSMFMGTKFGYHLSFFSGASVISRPHFQLSEPHPRTTHNNDYTKKPTELKR